MINFCLKKTSFFVAALYVFLLCFVSLASAEMKVLSLGSKGKNVKVLNKQLFDLSYVPAYKKNSNVFDQATFHGVVAYQKTKGIDRDGVAGRHTRMKLLRSWNARSVPKPKQKNLKGKWIEVNLARQTVYLVKSGKVRRTIAISSGDASHATPAGNFKVLRKEERSWSVPFKTWLPWASYFNGGIAFHQYDSVPVYPASHGCVRVPAVYAKELYRFASMNTPVFVR